MVAIKTLQSIDVEFSADSVETCPLNRELIACGTYQLLPDELDQQGQRINSNQHRVGRIYFYDYEKTSDTLLEWARIESNAILDMKWSSNYHQEKVLLAVGDAMGELSIYKVDKQNASVHKECGSIQGENQLLVLSLDWSDRLQKKSPQLISSLSDGHLALTEFTESSLQQVQDWKAHDFEAWICAFNCWNTNIVLSGGDDCIMKCWDTRTVPAPLWINRRHEMGVTSLQWHPQQEYTFASGSYDESVRIWDSRSMKQPIAEESTGGGVWRIKWHPYKPDQLLVASMYNGFHQLNLDSTGLHVRYSYDCHESIAYGVDWILSSEGDQERIASCSFYDHRLDLWAIQAGSAPPSHK